MSFKNNISAMWNAHGGTVLLAGGLAGMTAGAVLACVKSVKEVPATLAEESEALAEAKETQDGRKIARQAIVSAVKIARHYIIPATIFSIGGVSVVMAKQHEHKKLIAVAGAYNSLLAAYEQYRKRVIEAEGEEQDRKYIHGETDIEIVEEKEGKNGKKRKTTKIVKAIGSGDSESLYHRHFCRATSSQWIDDPMYNFQYLKVAEQNFNNKLQAQGYVLLSDVYDTLGFELEGHSNAAMVGWILGDGDNYIDFGIYSPNHSLSMRSENNTSMAVASGMQKPEISKPVDDINWADAEYEGSFWLDFNCDGIIIDKI